MRNEHWVPQDAQSPEHSQAMPPVMSQESLWLFCPVVASQPRQVITVGTAPPHVAHLPRPSLFKDSPGSCPTFSVPSPCSSQSNFSISPEGSPGVGEKGRDLLGLL